MTGPTCGEVIAYCYDAVGSVGLPTDHQAVLAAWWVALVRRQIAVGEWQ